MSVLNVAMVGSEELGRRLGKKGDSRDIESFVHKESRDGEVRVLSLLRPLKHPDSIRPLLSVLGVAKAGLLEISELNPAVGEAMVAFGCSGISDGFAIISPNQGEWIDPDQVEMMLQQAGLGGWRIKQGELDEHEIREGLFGIQDDLSGDSGSHEGALILPVDQHFNVKGVGLVAIGYVQSGRVSRHDEVEVLPAGEVGVVRSLQVMDDDVELATAGDRVGLALRNLREQSLHRGCMICMPGSGAMERHESTTFDLAVAPFQRKSLEIGDVVHASSDMQFIVGRVSTAEESTYSINWDSPLWVRSDGTSRIQIVQLDAVPMRIMGVAKEIRAMGE
ncbi:MAG: hypothetical protein CMA12_03145 [Euryarchaeota archaeon]|nr:hypothetical protein [Euryarchaeota archaeon]